MLMLDAMMDVRSVTGCNMRNNMLLVGKKKVEDFRLSDLDSLTYFKLKEIDKWNIPMIKKAIETKVDVIEVPGFDREELANVLHHLYTE